MNLNLEKIVLADDPSSPSLIERVRRVTDLSKVDIYFDMDRSTMEGWHIMKYRRTF